jgi:hypothetical protein
MVNAMKSEALKNFFKEYKEYLVETDHTANVAEQYCTYLRGAVRDLDVDDDFWEYFAESNNTFEHARLSEILKASLYEAKSDSTCVISKRDLANYNSAINQLIAFVSTTPTKHSTPAVRPLPPTLIVGATSSYDRADLISIFKSRLKTQDRFYAFGTYPARIVGKIIANSLPRIDLYEKLINETKFLCGPSASDFYLLKNVDKLTIARGRAYIEVSGRAYMVYTETFKKGISAGFVPATVNTMSDLSLDHIQPMYDVLKSCLPSYTEYLKFSDSVLSYRRANPKTSLSIFSSDYYTIVYPTLKLDEQKLIDEIFDFIGRLSLVIMDRKSNSSKSKSIVTTTIPAVHMGKTIEEWVPCSQHFFRYHYDALVGIGDDLLSRMEGEYECILGFGRDEVFGKACEERIERIPVLLSPEIKKRTYKPSNEEIAEEIYELFNPNCRNASKKDIVAILEKAKQFTDTVTGEFVKAEQPYIVLYYKAIGGKNKEEKIARLANVLAHEYMHYMEYRYCLAHVVESYQNEKLSEAMADFFAELYTLKNEYYASKERKTVAKCRYDLWLERFGSCWPYAKALHFYTVCGNTMNFSDKYCDYEQYGSVKKLCEVFGNSYDSIAAYNSLLYI